MQFTLSTIAAVAALLPAASAHLFITKPKMFANHQQAAGFVLDPLDPSGSNFPCQNGTPDETVPAENMLSYGKNVLQVSGTAVHGGGSGQMVITYDFPPPADVTKWRVLTSYEGNHPMSSPGNLPIGTVNGIPANTYTVWDFLPPGKATVAWNWFNHVGNREHYMKCATVSIGGSTKIVQGAMESSALKKLPTMFRANSDNGKCTVSPEQANIKFKNPGKDVIGTGDSVIPCDNTIAGTSSGSPTTPEKPDTPAPTSSTPDNEENEGTDDGEDTAAPSEPETPEPELPTAPVSPPVSSPAPPVKTPIVKPPTTKFPVKKPIAKPAPSQPETPTQPTPGNGVCTEGTVTCNDDGTWSLCGSGALHNMGGTGAGRICKNGELTLDPKWATWGTQGKRSVRFSAEHRRRRH